VGVGVGVGRETMNRRELKTRQMNWPRVLARWLAAARMTPNQVSVLSILFSAAAWMNFREAGQSFWKPWLMLVTGAVAIQLRLLCNLLDGLLAIEGGLKTKTGDLYNEVPDRIADAAILIGAGLAVRHLPYGSMLGWAAALVAVLTAYARLLGGSFGFAQDFVGPMAKQHRMFAVTVGALAAAIETAQRGTVWSLYVALWIVLVGSIVTFARRLRRIARQLETR
jgi:phosphatidylglycerophosphate synthase